MNIITNQFHPSMIEGCERIMVNEVDPEEVISGWDGEFKVYLMGPKIVLDAYENDLNINIERNNSTRPPIRDGDNVLVGIPNRKITQRNEDEMILWYLITV